jgi:hypothetical protein
MDVHPHATDRHERRSCFRVSQDKTTHGVRRQQDIREHLKGLGEADDSLTTSTACGPEILWLTVSQTRSLRVRDAGMRHRVSACSDMPKTLVYAACMAAIVSISHPRHRAKRKCCTAARPGESVKPFYRLTPRLVSSTSTLSERAPF